MKMRPLHDRVIVKRMEEERTSPGGIVIPDAATEPGRSRPSLLPFRRALMIVGQCMSSDTRSPHPPRCLEGRRTEPWAARQPDRHFVL